MSVMSREIWKRTNKYSIIKEIAFMRRRPQRRRPARRTPKRRMRTVSRPQQAAQEKLFTFHTVVFLGLITLMCFSVILIQSYRINRVNIQINKLQAKLEDARMLNDSLEGQLLSTQNLKKVENIAKNTYGMVEPKKKDYVAVDMNDSGKDSKTSNSGNNTARK